MKGDRRGADHREPRVSSQSEESRKGHSNANRRRAIVQRDPFLQAEIDLQPNDVRTAKHHPQSEVGVWPKDGPYRRVLGRVARERERHAENGREAPSAKAKNVVAAAKTHSRRQPLKRQWRAGRTGGGPSGIQPASQAEILSFPPKVCTKRPTAADAIDCVCRGERCPKPFRKVGVRVGWRTRGLSGVCRVVRLGGSCAEQERANDSYRHEHARLGNHRRDSNLSSVAGPSP